MKTKTLLLLSAGLLAAACSPTTAPEGYTLTGHIEGLPDSTHVQLIPLSHDREQPIADTLVINGTFTFSGQADEPRAMLLTVKDDYGSRKLMLENAEMTVNGRVTATKAHDGKTMYDLKTLSIDGSPLTLRYDSLTSIRTRMDSIHTTNRERHKAISEAVGKAAQAKDEAKLKALKAGEAYQALLKDDSIFFKTVEENYTRVILENKDTYWGPLMMITLYSWFDNSVKPLYEQLSDNAKNSYYGKKVKEELYPAGQIGTKVAEFTVKDTEGKDVTLASLRQGKKYLLIDFWASWCNPCRKEIPNLKKLYKLYADQGFDIVSISIDKKKADWEKALKEEQLPWHNFLDETGVADLYKVKFVPHHVLDRRTRCHGRREPTWRSLGPKTRGIVPLTL